MVVITISATDIGSGFVSGIPLQVGLETNIPATMFYTLDGSIPTMTSDVYLQPILMPTDENTVILRVMAISGVDKGYFNCSYSSDVSIITKSRRIEGYGSGIIVDAYDVSDILTDGYTDDIFGNINIPTRSSDYELTDLDIKYSSTGPNGEGLGTLISMGFPSEYEIQRNSAIDPNASSPNNQNVFFDPRSLYIVIDGRDGYQDQSIFIVNRPWGSTMDITKYMGGQTLYRTQPYISGGHVRTFYNYDKGLIVAYYFDSNELRWIKSIQKIDSNKFPKRIGDRNICGPPIVFKWVYNKRDAI